MTDRRGGSREAGPLGNGELLDEEKALLIAVHSELELLAGDLPDAGSRATSLESRKGPWAQVDRNRRNQTFVIDGGRGTGKTSLLLTLIRGWNEPAGADLEDEDERAFRKTFHTDLIRALPVLDFDPLPDRMSVHGWLLQPWLALVEHLSTKHETRARQPSLDGGQPESLYEAWRRVQDAAIAGWQSDHDGRSPSERLLDERQRLREYTLLQQHWMTFVDRAFSEVKALLPNLRLVVVPIDDVDLQVGRNVELIHAIRLFQHPRVAYLLTADLHHTRQVLRLHFERQHYDQGKRSNEPQRSESALEVANDLAASTLKKAFPKAFRSLGLTLKQVLHREIDGKRVVDLIEGCDSPDPKLTLKQWLTGWAESGLGSTQELLTFRQFQALAERLRPASDAARPLEVLRALVDPRDDEGPDGRTRIAEFHYSGKLPDFVQYRRSGWFKLWSPVDWSAGSPNQLIQVGTEFHGRLLDVPGTERDFASMALAHALSSPVPESTSEGRRRIQRRSCCVRAPELRLDPGTVFIWTYWSSAPRNAYLVWPFATNPHIADLPAWMADWQETLQAIGTRENVEELLSYSWFELQGRWSSRQLNAVWDESLRIGKLTEGALPWPRLAAGLQKLAKPYPRGDLAAWLSRYGILLAAPEYGLPNEVQKSILHNFAPGVKVAEDLAEVRLQAIIDGFRQCEESVEGEEEEAADDSELKEDAGELLEQLDEREEWPWRLHGSPPHLADDPDHDQSK